VSDESTSTTRKTPAERAQAEYDLAVRGVDKAQARADKTKADADKAAADLRRAQHRVTMAGTHPDLPEGVASTPDIEADATAAAEPAVDPVL